MAPSNDTTAAMTDSSAPRKTAYERLQAFVGGDPSAALAAVVDKLYELILADATLAPFFAGKDMERQKAHMGAFVSTAIGATNGPKYSGRTMAAVHARPRAQGLNEGHFNSVAGHLIAAMKSLNVPEDIIDETLSIVATTKDAVLHGKQ